jgi:hypothetical protein
VILVHVVLSGDDCHCAVLPDARLPIERMVLLPLHIVLADAVGAGLVLDDLVSVMNIS